MRHWLEALVIVSTLLVTLIALAAPDRSEPRIVTVEHEPPGDTPILGPRYAAVTIEFFINLDMGGVTNRRIHKLLVDLQEDHPRRLRVLYRLVRRPGGNSFLGEAGREAFSQGRFFEFLDALYSKTRRRKATAKAVEELYERAGLDHGRFEQARVDGRHTNAIDRDVAHWRRRRVTRMPSILINGFPYNKQPRSIQELEALYDDGYARARKLLDDGATTSELYKLILRQVDSEREPMLIGGGQIDGRNIGERARNQPPDFLGGTLDTTGPHERGADAPMVTLLFFCHSRSNNCRSLWRNIELMLDSYPDELHVVFKHYFPDDAATDIRLSQEASECAADQGSFWEFYRLMIRFSARREMTIDELVKKAEKLELDTDRFRSCLENGDKRDYVESAREASRRAGVRYSPSIAIGGLIYSGTKSPAELQSLIDQELSPGLLDSWAP